MQNLQLVGLSLNDGGYRIDLTFRVDVSFRGAFELLIEGNHTL